MVTLASPIACWPRLMRTLQTDDLIIEPQTESHAEAMYRLLCDPAIYEFEDEPPPSLDWLRRRFRFLVTRLSPDDDERWLNWVIRLPGGNLAGYVQASVLPNGTADIAYVLGSDYWGKGYARRAVEAMIAELHGRYGVHTLRAVFKTANFRSRRLLERLSFGVVAADDSRAAGKEPDESVMVRRIRPSECGTAESADALEIQEKYAD
jgi:RimJ/RimL family protein N-acetyltransferase